MEGTPTSSSLINDLSDASSNSKLASPVLNPCVTDQLISDTFFPLKHTNCGDLSVGKLKQKESVSELHDNLPEQVAEAERHLSQGVPESLIIGQTLNEKRQNKININHELIEADCDKVLTTKEKVWTSLFSGGIAGALAKTAIAPLDRTKIYFQTKPHELYTSKAVYRFLKQTYNEHGMFYLWKGNSATMARIIPYAAVQFSSHEQWKRLMIGANPQNIQNEELRRFIAGSLAGMTALSLTYPLDLSRARMAVRPNPEYRTLRSALSTVYRENGLLALYRGYGVALMGVIPYAGVSFYTYDFFKREHKKKFANQNSDKPYPGPTPSERLMFGACAGAIGQTCSYPLDIIRRRLQVSDFDKETLSKRPRIAKMLWRIAREEGVIRGLFKGLSMNWIKGPIAAGISFSVNDLLLSFIRNCIT